jgi:branched-chain amino acid transport system ATP-binding protein
MAELLTLANVTAGYADTVVLEDVSLALPEGAAWALLGRNGVGKTTLLATLMGLTELRAGTLRIRRRRGHRPGLPPYDRATAAASATCRRRARSSRRSPCTRICAWRCSLHAAPARRAGRTDRVYELLPAPRRAPAHHRGNQLSGGEQQMLAVAPRPRRQSAGCILLDEPLEGLAPVIVDTLIEAFTRLRGEGGIATILVEQQVEVALALTDHAIVLDRGRIAWQGASSALAEDRERLASLIGLQDAAPPPAH